jgi:predicted pyridoxine 5'-phosphate oxidase superfamily flavin-nucleotide-binding protein
LDAAPDVSPRGDAPGFVSVVGPDRLHLPDRIGNNRIDTIQNVLRDPRVALVFICTGDDRILQITGVAQILVDPKLLAEYGHCCSTGALCHLCR